MFETKGVGDNFEMLVIILTILGTNIHLDSKDVINIAILTSTLKTVTNFKSPTSLSPFLCNFIVASKFFFELVINN